MALSKWSTGRKLGIKYPLAEELEDEETLLEIVRKPRAKIHDMFKLRCEEGLFNKLIIGHIREEKKFSVSTYVNGTIRFTGCPAISSTNSSSSFAENAGAMMQHTLTAQITVHD